MKKKNSCIGRHIVFVGIITLLLFGVLYKLVYLQVINKDFLQKQGEVRSLRKVGVKATRGIIVDRNNEPLAVSIPVQSIWVNPKEFANNFEEKNVLKLSKLLKIKEETLRSRLKKQKEFVYLKRKVNPEIADKVESLNLVGVYLQTEYKRFYPSGEVSAHLIGFTGIDDQGQEGLELSYNKYLSGVDGVKKVVKDRRGHEISHIDELNKVVDGEKLQLSLDQRLQYLAYRELKNAIKKHKAKSGSVVIIKVKTGEVLAMTNWPTFNPNQVKGNTYDKIRNRAVTDFFEPGSAMKTFSMLSVLEHTSVQPYTKINTYPGKIRLKGGVVRDAKNYGVMDAVHILQHSSNVGMTKLVQKLSDPINLWETYTKLGFGVRASLEFPGESSGLLLQENTQQPFVFATMAFGYGVAVTPLQLARAYSILGTGGISRDISFTKLDKVPDGVRVFDSKITKQVTDMLVKTIRADRHRAYVPGYIVAGKTGTSRKLGKNGYLSNKHKSSFAGLAPASNAEFAIVVKIDEPTVGGYYGNIVAAPVFSKIAQGALRLYNIKPAPKIESLVAKR